MGQSASFTTRFSADPTFRLHLFRTLCLCWSFLHMGWGLALQGPTFPNIRLIINKDLKTASWFFTLGALGRLIGSLFGGLWYDRGNKTVMLMTSTAGIAITTAVLPWCISFPGFLAVRLLWGIFNGFLMTGVNADIIYVWKTANGPYLQAAHFCFSVGSIMAPVVATPFLSKAECLDGMATGLPQSHSNHTDDSQGYHSAPKVTNHDRSLSINSTIPFRNHTNCERSYGDASVHHVYILTAFLMLSSTAFYAVLYIYTKRFERNNRKITNRNTKADQQIRLLAMKQKILFMGLIGALGMCYLAAEKLFSGFLTTFTQLQLQWAVTKGALATGVYWGAHGTGRFVGIFVVRFVKSEVWLSTTLSLTVCSVVAILVGVTVHSDLLIWIGTATIGACMSTVYPCFMSWSSNTIITLSGTVFSIVYFIHSLGTVTFHPLAGYLMDNSSPMWFLYILLIVTGLACGLLLLILFMKRLLLKPLSASSSRQPAENTTIELPLTAEDPEISPRHL